MSGKKYSTWIDGTEIQDNHTTLESAVEVLKKYIAGGYSDVSISCNDDILQPINNINLGVTVYKDEKEYNNDKGQLVSALDADFGRCPICESSNISYGEPDPENIFIYRKHSCEECGTTWEERYDLVQVKIEPSNLEIIEKIII